MKNLKPFKPTRSEILRATRLGVRPPKGVPQAVIDEVERKQDDYVVAWTQGLAAHIPKIDAAKAMGERTRKPKMVNRKATRRH